MNKDNEQKTTLRAPYLSPRVKAVGFKVEHGFGMSGGNDEGTKDDGEEDGVFDSPETNSSREQMSTSVFKRDF